MERRPNTQTVQWFIEAAGGSQLRLDPPFQRRTVWSNAYRQYFIDTVLRNFPSPAIFLAWQIKPGNPTIYEVVDGKQRLSAILDFVQDKFHLGGLFENEVKRDAFWSDLGEDRQKALVNYVLTVENISGASSTELRDAFDRLNRNVARLTPQELRHAQYGDLPFTVQIEQLAELSFWSEQKVITPSNVRRMRDVEFVSELMVLTIDGIVDGASDVLDRYYAKFADGEPDVESHLRDFNDTLDLIEAIPIDWKRTRWNNMTDFYGLWGAVRRILDDGEEVDPGAAADALLTLDKGQRAMNAALKAKKDPPRSRINRAYYDASRQGPNKETNRETRIEIIEKLLRDA